MSATMTRAAELHTRMLEAEKEDGGGLQFNQKELMELVEESDPQGLMNSIQELSNLSLIRMVKDQNGQLLFVPVARDEATKLQSMSEDEAMVYSLIQSSAREGIWTKTIKARTNLHQSVVLRCLKRLESKLFIKSVKSVKYPTRKIYMLATLQPSQEVTGGPWFTDSELDSEFIGNLMDIIWRFICSKSYPDASKQTLTCQSTFKVSFKSYPTIEDIHRFIEDAHVSTVELGIADIRSLCEVLVFDEKIERISSPLGGLVYKACREPLLATTNGFTGAPCGRCPVFELCSPNGPVNPSDCIYYNDWLLDVIPTGDDA